MYELTEGRILRGQLKTFTMRMQIAFTTMRPQCTVNWNTQK